MATSRADVSSNLRRGFIIICFIIFLSAPSNGNGLEAFRERVPRKRRQVVGGPGNQLGLDRQNIPAGADVNLPNAGLGLQVQQAGQANVNAGAYDNAPGQNIPQGNNLVQPQPNVGNGMLKNAARLGLDQAANTFQRQKIMQGINANPNQPQLPPGPVIQEPKKNSKTKFSQVPVRIAEVPQCIEDYQRRCRTINKGNNFAVLECLQNSQEDQSGLTVECNQFLWGYKKNLTIDPRFDQAAQQVCNTDMQKLTNCTKLKKGSGDLLPCLFEHKEDITDTHCRQYLTRMEIITFSDYRLIKGFYEDCRDDIELTKCGSVLQPKADSEPTHKQGMTIECLQKAQSLTVPCKRQILRVAELQADDYQLDRQLYFSCKGDREQFCEKVMSGGGKVYKCLIANKKNPHMSDECREALTVRQKLVAQDYKVDKQLIKRCTKEIKKSKCSSGNNQVHEQALSVLLMCLEDWEDEGNQLTGDCQSELFDIRKSLLEDYMVNPEIVTDCAIEIQKHCKGLRKQGKTLHCLMGFAKRGELGENCKESIEDLIEETKAGSDYRMDSPLADACGKSISVLCPKIKAGDARVISCLMDNVDDPQMDDECSRHMLELQYFISRNFKLDPVLYKNCAADAKNLCAMDDINPNNQKKHPEGLVLACLHRHLHPSNNKVGLSASCATQVHRVLRQRAVSVHLNPRIEQKCRSDLGRFCQTTQGAEEMDCLQKNLKDLQAECKMLVANFTMEESEDVRMNKILMSACAPMLKKYCPETLRNQADEGEGLKCLIENKNADEMNEKCTAGIEHFQIITMQDYRLSFKFKQACRQDVIDLCSDKTRKDKSSILHCLSETLRNDILNDKDPKVSEKCRKELKFEMLQKSEDIKLDKDLEDKCKTDITNLCSRKAPGNAQILNCLREKKEDLSPECHLAVFKREKEYFEKPEWDYSLMHVCKKMIKAKCSTSSLETILQCLKTHMRDTDFDSSCQSLVSKRLVEQSSDFRLQPAMRRACKADMTKFCDELRKTKEQKDLQGQMLACLKSHLDTNIKKKGQSNVKRLSPMCESYVRQTMVDAALNFKLDPKLRKSCSGVVRKFCVEALEQPGSGMVEECLKDLMRDKKIDQPACVLEVSRIMQEGLADIHVDPLLYKACSLDLKHYCHGVTRGQGQQMSCLLEALQDKHLRLQPDCKRMLDDRKQLWELAAEVAPPETLNELYLQVMQSPRRNNFLLIFLSFAAGMLFFGIFCGRVTKRVSTQVKNK